MLLVLTCLAAVVNPITEFAKNNATLELNLRAIEAFERGPVILEASITNRGTRPLIVEQLRFFHACWLSIPQSWNLERREREPGCPRIFPSAAALLKPGETYTDRHYLNCDYRSSFPSGKHEIGVYWRLWTVRERKTEFGVRPEPDQLAAFPAKKFQITISPATPVNRWALACRLEAEFASLPPPSDKDGDPDGPFLKFCDSILYAPHPELLPLYFRMLDRTPLTELFGRVAEDKIAESIFEADPQKAHRIFVDRLLAPKADFHSYIAFYLWTRPVRERPWPPYSTSEILQPERWFEPEWWPQWCFGYLELLTQRANNAKRRLSDAELLRLAAAKDFNVRERIFSMFRHRLSDDWCDAFIRDRDQRRKNP